MSLPLTAPGDQYSVTVDALASPGGPVFVRHQANTGVPYQDGMLVVVGDVCTLVLVLGENGLTVRNIKLLNADHVMLRAQVTAGGAAPDWLPTESSYMLFEGDRTDAAQFRERFVPLAGMADDGQGRGQGGEEQASLDRLAVAVGRSVARANATLARTQASAGVALVQSVTIRLAVEQTDLGQGRVLVTLARPGQSSDQYVELTMTTVPGAEPPDDATGGTTAGVANSSALRADGLSARSQNGSAAGRFDSPKI